MNPFGPKPLPAVPPFPPRDRREAALLRAIAEGDQPSRLIYADWLEQQGHDKEARFVRATEELVAAPDSELLRKMVTTIANVVDDRWQQRVARPAVENCVKFSFKCPKEWGGLTPTANPKVRHCDECKKSVFHCTNVPDAREHAKRGECVALDLVALRWRRDLEPPYGSDLCPWCRCDLGSWSGDDCPRCGGTVRSMTVGGIG